MKPAEQARFDTRLPREHKELFEYAAELGGYRNLTDYVIQVLMERSQAIIEKHNAIVASKKDQKIFFEAITADIEPNAALLKAAQKYKRAVGKK
ncbi:MAG: DUF1778 domain-containing protein [Flavobacteriales bacterium]|jgi:uncharacterized protein (DUF1778 family)